MEGIDIEENVSRVESKFQLMCAENNAYVIDDIELSPAISACRTGNKE